MDTTAVENRILELCIYVKKIEMIVKDDSFYAIVYPDFEVLKKNNIINIQSEIRWYGIELYNMEVEDSQKIRAFEIVHERVDSTQENPNDPLYLALISFIATLSDKTIFYYSHLELDLELDSLNYVELFVFVEESFGVHIDEKIFSKMMRIDELYKYIKENQNKFEKVSIEWRDILDKKINYKLIYSPIIISLFKIFLLPFFKLYFSLEVKGKENILQTSSIIAPNHQSMLDGFLVLATLPFDVLKRSFFVSFKQVFGKGILKPIAKHGQNILIDANENIIQTLQFSATPLKEGSNLVIFPEGARSRDKQLLEFRPFYAILSQTYKTPIIPVVIEGAYDALKTGSIFPLPKKIRVTYLKPIYPKGMSYEEINVRVREAIEKESITLKPHPPHS